MYICLTPSSRISDKSFSTGNWRHHDGRSLQRTKHLDEFRGQSFD